MKKIRLFVTMIMMIPFITGMGAVPKGNVSPEKIPVPDRSFTGVCIDQMDIATNCTEISIEGKTFVEGKMGEGTYTVDFQNIKSIDFLSAGDTMVGRLQLHDGSVKELGINGNFRVYGRTGYGTFQITIIHLKRIIFASRGQ